MMTSPSLEYLSYNSLTCGMASAQNGQSNAQKSMSTTFPRKFSSLRGAELIQASPVLSSGAFWPTKVSSGCCAQAAAAVINNNASVNFRSIVVPRISFMWRVFCHNYHLWSMSCSGSCCGKRGAHESGPSHVLGSGFGTAFGKPPDKALQGTRTGL